MIFVKRTLAALTSSYLIISASFPLVATALSK